MKIFIITIILAVIAIFLYFSPNVAKDIKHQIKNSERCAEFDINDGENGARSYGFGIKKLLKGCF